MINKNVSDFENWSSQDTKYKSNNQTTQYMILSESIVNISTIIAIENLLEDQLRIQYLCLLVQVKYLE